VGALTHPGREPGVHGEGWSPRGEIPTDPGRKPGISKARDSVPTPGKPAEIGRSLYWPRAQARGE